MPLRERDLTAPVASLFMDLGYEVFEEVPIVGRYADLFGVGSDLVAVELKLEDWRGAFRQAIAYQLAADRAYIALPLERAHAAHRNRHIFERERVGLLAVDVHARVREVVPAGDSPRRIPFVAKAVLRRIDVEDRPADAFGDETPKSESLARECSESPLQNVSV